MNGLREQLFNEAASSFNHCTIRMRHKRALWWSGSFRMFLSHRHQLHGIYFCEKVFALRVMRGFIGVNARSIGKRIGIILSSINGSKTPRRQQTRDRLTLLGHQQRDFQTIKISLLAGLRASKLFSSVYRGASKAHIVADSNGEAINDVHTIRMAHFPCLAFHHRTLFFC